MAKTGIFLGEYEPYRDAQRGAPTRLPIAPIDLSVPGTPLNALNTVVIIPTSGRPGVGGVIKAGNLTATLTFEHSFDGGVTWANAIVLFGVFQVLGTQAIAAGPAGDTVLNFIGGWGVTHYRIRVSAYTSGSATLYLTASNLASALAIGALSSGFVGQTVPFFANVIGGRVTTGGLPTAATTGNTQYARLDAYARLSMYRHDTWTATGTAGAAGSPTCNNAAQGAGIKNVCTSITCCLASAAASTIGVVDFQLLDGATVKWVARTTITAVAGDSLQIVVPDLWIEGTANTAMTLNTAAALPTAAQGSVSMTGTITQ